MNYRPNLFSIFVSILCFISLSILSPGQSLADTTSLTISPTLIRIEAKPPADVWTPFTLENKGNQPVLLLIGYKAIDPQASSNGNVVFQNDSQSISGVDKKIFEKIQIVDDQNNSRDSVVIGPKQQLHLRLRVLLANKEPTSDYYFSLIFLETAPQVDQNNTNYNIENQKSYSSLQTGIGLNVLLAVGDKEVPVGKIDNFSSPLFLNNGPVSFNLTIHNSSVHFIQPYGEIVIKNFFGETVGKVNIPSTTILAGTSRNFFKDATSANSLPLFSRNTNVQGLIWKEDFLFGSYTAILNLKLSSEGPVYIKTIHFLAFPVLLLVKILLVLCLIGFIYLRVKNKLSS